MEDDFVSSWLVSSRRAITILSSLPMQEALARPAPRHEVLMKVHMVFQCCGF
jgi:hypothetical protein